MIVTSNILVIIAETFEGEKIHEFHGFRAICESFLHKILGMPHPPYMIDLAFPVFLLLYLKGVPRPVCEWLVCKIADSCNSGLQYGSRDTLLVYCSGVLSTCTHTLYTVTIIYPIIIFSDSNVNTQPPCLNSVLEETLHSAKS